MAPRNATLHAPTSPRTADIARPETLEAAKISAAEALQHAARVATNNQGIDRHKYQARQQFSKAFQTANAAVGPNSVFGRERDRALAHAHGVLMSTRYDNHIAAAGLASLQNTAARRPQAKALVQTETTQLEAYRTSIKRQQDAVTALERFERTPDGPAKDAAQLALIEAEHVAVQAYVSAGGNPLAFALEDGGAAVRLQAHGEELATGQARLAMAKESLQLAEQAFAQLPNAQAKATATGIRQIEAEHARDGVRAHWQPASDAAEGLARAVQAASQALENMPQSAHIPPAATAAHGHADTLVDMKSRVADKTQDLQRHAAGYVAAKKLVSAKRADVEQLNHKKSDLEQSQPRLAHEISTLQDQLKPAEQLHHPRQVATERHNQLSGELAKKQSALAKGATELASIPQKIQVLECGIAQATPTVDAQNARHTELDGLNQQVAAAAHANQQNDAAVHAERRHSAAQQVAFMAAMVQVETSQKTFDDVANSLIHGALRSDAPADSALTTTGHALAQTGRNLADTANYKAVVVARVEFTKNHPPHESAMMRQPPRPTPEGSMPEADIKRMDSHQVKPAVQEAATFLMDKKKPQDKWVYGVAVPPGAGTLTGFAAGAVASAAKRVLPAAVNNALEAAAAHAGEVTHASAATLWRTAAAGATLVGLNRPPPPVVDAGALDNLKSPQALGQGVAQLFKADGVQRADHKLETEKLSKLLAEQAEASDRPAGHPLRYEEPMLLAMALRQSTSDPATAIKVLENLKHPSSVPPLMADALPGPDGGAAAGPPHIDTDAALVQRTKRCLASTASGMDALLHLQGFPPPGDLNTEPARKRALNVDQYKQSLRAESAVIAQPAFGLHQNSTTEQIRASLDGDDKKRVFGDKSLLGSSSTLEQPGTLAYQAFKHLDAQMSCAPTVETDGYKPAYVALRNGFTESGKGSAFNKMVGHMRQFSQRLTSATATEDLNPVRHLLNGLQRVSATPAEAMLHHGSLGSHLSVVTDEYKRDLTSTLEIGSQHLTDKLPAVEGDPLHRAKAQVRLCALQQWRVALAAENDPTQVKLSEPDLRERARAVIDPAVFEAHRSAIDASIRQTISEQTQPGAGPATLAAWLPLSNASERTPVEVELNTALRHLGGQERTLMDAQKARKEYASATVEQRQKMVIDLVVDAMRAGDMYSQRTTNSGGFDLVANIPTQTPTIVPVGASYLVSHGNADIVGTGSNFGRVSGTQFTQHIASAAVGVGKNFSNKVSGSAEIEHGMARETGEGFNMYIRKAGADHNALAGRALRTPEDKGNRRVLEVATKALLNPPAGPGGEPANSARLWRHMAEQVGHYTDISFSFFTAKSSQTSNALQGNLSAGGKAVLGKASLSGTARATSTSARQESAWADEKGALRTFESGKSISDAVRVRGSVVVADIPSALKLGSERIEVKPRLNGQISGQTMNIKTKGFARLSTDDGRIDPSVSFKQREFSDRDTFMRFVASQHNEWAQALTPTQMADFMKLTLRGPDPIYTKYVERKTIRPEAAEWMNAHLTQIDLLKQQIAPELKPSKADVAKAKALIASKEKAVRDGIALEANWQPFRLFVNDTNRRMKSAGLTTPTRFEVGAADKRKAPPVDPDGAGLQVHRQVLREGARDRLVVTVPGPTAPNPAALQAMEHKASMPADRYPPLL